MSRTAHATLALLTLVALAGCATNRVTREPRQIERPVVERLGQGKVRLRWPDSFTHGPVNIYVGETSDSIDRTRLVARATGMSIELTEIRHHSLIGDGHRLYYELARENGDSVIVAERRLPLVGADNFRDLGGYRTADGRTVRWGRVYRSSELAGLTAADMAYLSEIGIEVIVDLRSERERAQNPNPVIEPLNPHELVLPVQQRGMEPNRVQQMIQTGTISAFYSSDVMLTAYRSFVTDYAPQWALLLQQLQDPGSTPLVFHCTAGKDRTGFAAAVFLLALGVPEETVLQDYLATNWYRRNFTNMVLRFAPIYSLFRTEPADVLPLLAARRDYLEASIDLMKERYGSIDAYLEESLGLTAEKRAALQREFLVGEVLTSEADPER